MKWRLLCRFQANFQEWKELKHCAPPAADSPGQLMIMAAAFREHRLTGKKGKGRREDGRENQSNTPRARRDSMEPATKEAD